MADKIRVGEQGNGKAKFERVTRLREPVGLEKTLPLAVRPPFCPAKCEGFVCTLGGGHPGVHAAHTNEDKPPCYVWE